MGCNDQTGFLVSDGCRPYKLFMNGRETVIADPDLDEPGPDPGIFYPILPFLNPSLREFRS